MLAQDVGISVVAKATGLSRQAVYRIRDEPAGAEAALAKWGMSSGGHGLNGEVSAENGASQIFLNALSAPQLVSRRKTSMVLRN